MPKTLDEQMAEIFGPGFNAEQRAADTQMDAALERDLKAFLDTPNEVLESISDQIAKYVDQYGLSHSQLAAVLLGVIVEQANHCPVANYVSIRSVETTLRALLDGTAKSAGQPVLPLLEATVSRLLGADGELIAVG